MTQSLLEKIVNDILAPTESANQNQSTSSTKNDVVIPNTSTISTLSAAAGQIINTGNQILSNKSSVNQGNPVSVINGSRVSDYNKEGIHVINMQEKVKEEEDAFWSLVCLSGLLFVLFAAIYLSKLWRPENQSVPFHIMNSLTADGVDITNMAKRDNFRV
ncbi:uncharacterized protein LOC142350332 isoform X2 [Convolutriloba macropyga]|uniref:uncharacterized protein LOC142350332 isoform X2 n=1 Tax=Convolutriloba macropyga TaxID=536237 RepID=UPI003F524480